MDLDSVQTELNALGKLYRLLEINGSDEQSAISETLDEESRVMLRKLLDGNAQRVLETHIKKLADNWRSLVATPCLGQLEEAKKTQKSQSPGSSYAAKSPSFNNQNIKKDLKCLEMLQKNEQSSESRMPNNVPSFTSRLRRSATDLQSRKKRCIACQQSSKLEMISIEHASEKKTQSANAGPNPLDEIRKIPTQTCASSIPDQGLEAKQSLEPVRNSDMSGNKTTSEIVCRSRDKESVASSASSMRPLQEFEDKSSNVEDFSKEVDDAIKRIESLIPSLHRLAKPVRTPTEKKVCKPDSFSTTNSILDSHAVGSSGRVNGIVMRSEQSQTRQSKHAKQGIQDCYEPAPTLLLPQQMSDNNAGNCEGRQVVSPKKGKFKEEEMKLLKSSTSQTKLIPKTNHWLLRDTACEQDGRIKGYRFLEESFDRVQGDFGSAKGKQIQRTSELSGPNAMAILEKMETLLGNISQNGNVADEIPDYIQRARISPSEFNTCNDNQDQSPEREVRRKTLTSRPPTLAPSTSSATFARPSQRIFMANSVHRVNRVHPKGSIFPKDNPSSRRNTRFRENSYWSSQSNILSGYDESDETYSDATTSSSWETVEESSYSSPSDTIETTSGYNSKDEDTGLSGYRLNYQDIDSESIETQRATSESSSRYVASSNNGPDYDGDMSPSEYYQADHHAARIRGAGRFRRLKNKLGLIFHHHHHHHHHDRSSQPRGSFWKQLGKMFRHTEKGETKNPKIERKRKHLVKSGSRKQQIGHFHALVDGLMRHVKHSNKSKQKKGSVGKLGGRYLGENKAVKNLHWWQNLGARRVGVQVPNKARVNLRGRNKKPQLTAAKKLLRHS